ncbi:laminin subunit alpha-1 [Tachyglossus aculeatus]|uniref:laminin subunit alpha-1 n=1 Tax=Tachyglossus aculeatus TaxID=9261 RepID=UPI0018F4FB94|nr:laminin subunit alpha-1 [Tachyglossus aculeatus]
MRCWCGRALLLATLLWSGGDAQQRGLFPAILNLASNAHIRTNATCGEKGPEMFCKLVEHVPGRPVRNAQCRICDHNSANSKEHHPISNAIDGTNNWWQSPSIQNGREYHWVTITLDLRQIFQVAYIIIKAANSPRPGNWILERSLDGTKFTPWQYYAISDTECLTRYNITPRLGPPTYKRDDEVICTSYYSRLVPLEHGEIHTSLINGRPSADDLSPKLLEFTSARYIRLRLQRIRTLNADLMTLSHREPKDLDPIVTRRYYYSIKDISIGGMCICYGHASSCPWDETTKKLQCQCEHNTCGESCNTCCPGYHQQPWRPGTISSGNTCEECNCHNKAADCYYDQSVAEQKKSVNIAGEFIGGGVCLNCAQNTAGINCETCIDGYYRPHKVSPYENNPCLPCDCDPFGSLSYNCIKDDSHADLPNGNWPGQCQCKEGYSGEKCDHCQFGYRGYPHCVRCNCSLAGSVNDDPCSEPCLCKENVEGEDCDHCKPGFYNLKGRNPQGCTECFCFGVSDVCESLAWSVNQVTDMSGWVVTDLFGENKIQTQRNQFDGLHQISINNTVAMKILKSIYYWSAPSSYLGNKLTSFGGYLKYTVSYDIPMETLDSDLMSHADVIIKGNGQTLSTRAEGLSLQPYEEYFNMVRLDSENFRDFNTKREVDRDQLMTVLANVTHLLIRANYNTAKRALYRLDAVALDTAFPNARDPALAADVEHCECPQGYTGISCESCIPGYYRVGGILFGGICKPCECHGHAAECDIHGVCSACQHNTTGTHCDRCEPGFYGTPAKGTSGDCQPCACPLTTASNNFSPTCHLEDGDELICDQCSPGYTGPWCERCAEGYYGNPMVPGKSCVPCDCNGNVDPLEDGYCDTVTGECLKCIGNTGGPHCERCTEGYYGDALIAKNCRACECHSNSSLSSVCHHDTGLCQCKPNVIGQHCDQCLDGFYGLNLGLGCLPCNCSESGSLSEDCSDEGQCRCVHGVSGEKCDQCARGFYAYQDGSCTPCNCAYTQNNCDPQSGECICPPHTQGPKCEVCEEQYWGHDQKLGCKACNCSSTGSSNHQCDLLTGQCQCKHEFGGQSCGDCALGFRDYPDCVPCDCEISGTREDTCNEKQGACSCEEETGTCSCKENVFGLHCSECKTGTFALQAENPLGCTPCFCFGLTQFCSEVEGHMRLPVTLRPDQSVLRVVSQSNLTGSTEGVYHQPPDVLLDAETVLQKGNVEPFYWRLPDHFQGDQLMAYGGKLKYSVAFYALYGTGTSNFEPQILIKGGHTSKLVIYVDLPAPENGVRMEHEIDMKEHIWKYFNSVSEKPVTRSDFMAVISNIEYILIKASYGQGLQQSRISNISMTIGVKAEESHSERETAHLIESCRCPAGFAGLSCQDCAPGYHRAKLPEISGIGPRPQIAPCVPCHCNNHTETCDPETGKCLNCRDNTTGDHCSVCSPGFYGKVTGSINDCSLCACPGAQSSSFSPTCVLEGEQDFRCDACFPGYEGQYCERCALGYYGNPQEPGGSCHQCECSLSGSVERNCNRTSGQCFCKPGVTGLLCDHCQVRHILVENECISCDDDCVGVLLNDLDKLSDVTASLNLTEVAPALYGILSDLENVTKHLKDSLACDHVPLSLETAKRQLENISESTDHVQRELNRILESGELLNSSSERMLSKSQDLITFVGKLQMTINELAKVATSLNETLAADFQLSNSTLQNMQEDIGAMLKEMRRRHFRQLHQNVTTEINAAENLLSRIQRNYHKPQQDLMKLKEDASHWFYKHSSKLQGAQDLVNEAHAKMKETSHLLLSLTNNLEELNEKELNVQESRNVSVMLIDKGKGLMDLAAVLAENVTNATLSLEVHWDEFLLWCAKIRHHVDDLVMQMSKRGALDLVFNAEARAAELQRLADSLDRGLSDVRNISLSPSNALHTHANIWDLIKDAEKLTEETYRILSDPLISEVEGLASDGKTVLQQGSKLLNEANTLSQKTQGVTSELSELKKKEHKFQENAHKITHRLNDSLQIFRTLPNGVREKAFGSKEAAMSANSSAISTLNDVMDFSRKLLNTSSALSRVNDTLRRTNEFISDSSKATVSAERKVKEVEIQANLLFDRLKPLKMLEENLSRNLSEIKELINQARKQAASIKVAVSADRDCIRAYQPQISSTNYNTLTLNVKTMEPDNLLFYLGSSASSDFLAVEMRRGKVAFLWDVGSGSTRLEYSDFPIDNNQWHSIYITRFGNTGSLTIKEISSTQKPLTKTAKSPGTANVLDINKSTLIFVGGLGGQIKKSPAVKVTHFKGCVGEASLNGKSIGLWNYIEREGKCDGCFGSLQNEDSSFHFDGSGYSVVEKTLRPTVTQIIMLFSTFSPNGLLLYLASNGTRDFLSIELVDGKVKVTVDLGSGPLALITEKHYNNGTWYKVAFQRNKKQGLLAVIDAHNPSSKETKQGESPGASSDLNRSDKDPIYVGGLPRSRVVRKGLTSRTYVGCIKSLEISRTTFDLLRNSYGVRKGCKLEPVRSVSFWDDGYLELQPKALSPESALMATFATKNSSGIIMAGLNKGRAKRSRRQAHVPFFSILLIEGHLEVYINPGDGMTTRKAVLHSTTGTFSDGREHSIILKRIKRIITVQVDDGNPAEMRFGAQAETRIMNVSNLYLGGIPVEEGSSILKMRKSFHGCIKNLILDMELLDFTNALRHEQVDMESCWLSEKPKPPTYPEDMDVQPEPQPLPIPEQCATEEVLDYIPGAHQFGLVQGSHLVLPFNHSTVRKKLSVQLTLRTLALDGLIYYMAHQSQADYAALQVHGGRLHFVFDLGKGKAKAVHPALISDGKWHSVKTEYIKRKGFIIVDGQESATVTTIGDGNTLDVEGKLYLGGLPSTYRAKNIGNVIHSIPACISDVVINSKQLDKESPISAFAVNKCYVNAQEGTFFDGSGFAALVKEGYKVRSDVNITLEFRTTSMNGVLLGISSAKVDAVGLELVNGKVLFHVNNGAGRITAAYEPKATRSLCDGKWHKLQANKSKHRIVLIVDGNIAQAQSPHVHSTSADTNNPIYVGGYPVEVRQNCLTSQVSFRGCLRRLVLSKGQQVEAFDLSRAFDLRGVFPHSCPGAER